MLENEWQRYLTEKFPRFIESYLAELMRENVFGMESVLKRNARRESRLRESRESKSRRRETGFGKAC